MCRRGARFSPASRFSTICVWAAPSKQLASKIPSRRCWRNFPRLKPLLDRSGGALSGGEQQLLAIARCLCGKPRLVLLDEPTEGIQPSIIEEIVEVLQRLRDNSGLTMILVEQNLDFIAALSKRILIIQKGKITREVQPGDLGDASLVGEFIGITT
jgi:branched-chain amino acid transport system ATP-binding protein